METTRRGFFGLVAAGVAGAALKADAASMSDVDVLAIRPSVMVMDGGGDQIGTVTMTAIEDDRLPPAMARMVARDWRYDPWTESYRRP